MQEINILSHVLIELKSAKFPNLAQWRLKYSDITQKMEHLLQTQ